MYKLVKPLLFSMDPETAHHQVTGALKRFYNIWGAKQLLKSAFGFEHPRLEREVFGLHFKNPVGLAAGFDKNAEYVEEMAALGFGFVEIGTVTPRPQPGNVKPRMFRLTEDEALINRMGFNNQGVDVAATRLRYVKNRERIVIGGNIGKNKDTPNEDAVHDLMSSFARSSSSAISSLPVRERNSILRFRNADIDLLMMICFIHIPKVLSWRNASSRLNASTKASCSTSAASSSSLTIRRAVLYIAFE